ncbi:hypothetical protein M569_06247, partial [Genlisea aurea]
LLLLLLLGVCEAHTNYTVGDSAGWYDALENPHVDYRKWAAGKTFTLGDYLVFDTDNNHSVIQTYNHTTYQQCDYSDASDLDTIQWSSADPSSTAPYPISVSVPLTKLGPTYFFSGDYDGEQCANGQKFQIDVLQGEALPPCPPPSSSPNDGGDFIPETLVPSNFDNPMNVSASDED